MTKLKPYLPLLCIGIASLLQAWTPLPGRAAELKQTEQTEAFSSFNKWCLNKNSIADSARHTVEVLLEEAGTQDCYAAGEKLANLTELSLERNQIADIRPLSRLTNLTALSLDDNAIADIRPLSGLTNLTNTIARS